MGIICLVGGVSYNISFAIFALEYYKAAYSIAFAKEGKSIAFLSKFHS